MSGIVILYDFTLKMNKFSLTLRINVLKKIKGQLCCNNERPTWHLHVRVPTVRLHYGSGQEEKGGEWYENDEEGKGEKEKNTTMTKCGKARGASYLFFSVVVLLSKDFQKNSCSRIQ
jgi:hypothetical protein